MKASYEHGVLDTENKLTKEVAIVCRDYCTESWGVVIGMATGRVRAEFLHTWTRPVGQDLQPKPGPIINRFFFFSGAQTYPAGPRRPHLAAWAQIWPNNFFLSPLRFFARFKPIQAIYSNQFKPFKPIKIFGIWATLYGSQINTNHRLIINQ